MSTIKDSRKEYDVCILGSGPAGLATLSAIQEPYSLDFLSEGQIYRAERHLPGSNCRGSSVIVIDPHPSWMGDWKKNFETLGIEFLRSPALAHPDMFDQNSLLAFAEIQNRQDELIESGCGDLRSLLPLGQSQIGLWKLPSVSLFADFCQTLVEQLPHEYQQGVVTDIRKEDDGGPLFEIYLEGGLMYRATAVVLAMGAVGRPVVPMALAEVPAHRLIQWTNLNIVNAKSGDDILVIGGGLTSLQVAQRLASTSLANITLCSRRPLVERHFDISIDWFDRRTTTKCMSDFYHKSHQERLALLKDSRGGGSIPGIYMTALRKLEAEGKVHCVVGNAEVTNNGTDSDDGVEITIYSQDGQATVRRFNAIILACGIKVDCETNPLCRKLLDRWPKQLQGGFPCLSEDLEWTDNLHVIGGLGSLSIGPDAANLMGMRRAAQIVSNSLECRCWLREANVLKNSFDALMCPSSDSDDISSSDEEN